MKGYSVVLTISLLFLLGAGCAGVSNNPVKVALHREVPPLAPDESVGVYAGIDPETVKESTIRWLCRKIQFEWTIRLG